MAIQAGLNDGPIKLQGTGGTTIIRNNANRTRTNALVIQNNASIDAEVQVYLSTTSSTAAADSVFKRSIPAGRDIDVDSLIGQGLPASYYILAVVNTAGIGTGDLIANDTYTVFTGDS